MTRKFTGLSLFLLFLASPVFAGTLTINAASGTSLEAKIQSDALLFKAHYVIENKGNEEAKNVFPVFQLNRWKFAGEPRSLKPNETSAWEIEEKIPPRTD